MTSDPIPTDDDLHAVLADVAKNAKAPPGARVSAARALLRGRRKPVQADVDDVAGDGAQMPPAVEWLEARLAAKADRIPCRGEHRGVALHDQQPKRRLDRIVRPAIDAVLAAEGVAPLIAYLEDSQQPPEARQLAWARLETIWGDAAANRARRPQIDMTRVRAIVAGLDSAHWRDPVRYTSLLDPDPERRAMPREKRLRLA